MRNVLSSPIVITLPNWFSAPIALTKELRITLPIALWAFLLMLLCRVIGEIGEMALAFLGLYLLSCAVIGAWAAGHDITYRTLGPLLALPISRNKIWARRMWLSFLVTLPLFLLAGFVISTPGYWGAPVASTYGFTWV